MQKEKLAYFLSNFQNETWKMPYCCLSAFWSHFLEDKNMMIQRKRRRNLLRDSRSPVLQDAVQMVVTTQHFIFTAMHAVNSLHSASFEADVIRVLNPPSHILALQSRPVSLTYRRTAQMTVTGPTRWHNLVTQRTTLWCHTFRSLSSIWQLNLLHVRKKIPAVQR